MATKADPFIEIINIDNERFKFSTRNQFINFIKKEKSAWSWLEGSPTEIINIAPHFLPHFDYLLLLFERHNRNEIDRATLINEINAFYTGPKPRLIVSYSKNGQSINAIRHSLGAGDGVIALGLVTPHLNPGLDHLQIFRVWMMLASPALIDWNGREKSHDEQLSKMKTQIANCQSSIESSLTKFDKSQATLILEAGKRMTGLMMKSAKRALQNNRVVRENARGAIAKIETTEKRYNELMNLRAPVQYWKEKKQRHNEARTNALLLILFFAAVGSVIGVMAFQWATQTILAYKTVTPIVITTSVALGTLFSLMFWVARVLLKIYLSERHLEGDATERETMTMSYLALLSDADVSDTDRTIILNSIFRPSQDGVVRDDGPSDYSAIAAIAKMLDPKK